MDLNKRGLHVLHLLNWKKDGFGTPMFNSFENYMTVLDTGFSSSFFMGLEQDDYNSVLSGIEMNYK